VTPSFVFDISATFDAKIAAVRAYDSQFTKNPSNLAVFDRLLAEGGYWGSQINRRYGEAFVSREQLRIYDTEHLLNA
jgi:LmbE family N-acetylglucosaminyl deacetylase